LQVLKHFLAVAVNGTELMAAMMLPSLVPMLWRCLAERFESSARTPFFFPGRLDISATRLQVGKWSFITRKSDSSSDHLASSRSQLRSIALPTPYPRVKIYHPLRR
jgi:hypothetical protein